MGILESVGNNAGFALNKHSSEMLRLQQQAGTGSRVNRASDAPTDAYRIMGLETHQRRLVSYQHTLAESISMLEVSLSVVERTLPRMSDIKTQLTQITSGTYTDEGRKRAAEGINDIMEQLLSMANTKHRDQYIFGGSSTQGKPFSASTTDGKITDVKYVGSDNTRKIEVAPGVFSSAQYAGDNVFSTNSRGAIEFSGDTGVKPGTGKSNTNGFQWLEVQFDTGLGQYKLSIDGGSNWTVSDGSETNLAVENPNTGQVLYVDATGINSQGRELVESTGKYDLFNSLIMLRDTLENPGDFSEEKMQSLQTKLINSLDKLSDRLIQTSVSMGSRINYLDGLKENLEDVRLDSETEATGLQQADIAQIAIELARHETLYQMSLSVVGKMLSVSLLNFIN